MCHKGSAFGDVDPDPGSVSHQRSTFPSRNGWNCRIEGVVGYQSITRPRNSGRTESDQGDVDEPACGGVGLAGGAVECVQTVVGQFVGVDVRADDSVVDRVGDVDHGDAPSGAAGWVEVVPGLVELGWRSPA